MARLLFNELFSGRWDRSFITGPNQDGKSLNGFVIPTMYILFELKETVILGVPSADLVRDKWRRDLLPVIQASRYADLLPRKGAGSREGDSVLFEFRNGQCLRFMTGGGDDQARASFTTKNLVVTETDGFGEVGSTSREGDKFSQLERRTLAFTGNGARTISECTVSTETGITWEEYQAGSASRICIPCPHCTVYVTPEREHFVGWQDAKTELEAVTAAHLICPACGAEWSNDQRIESNMHAVLAHRGQTVTNAGEVVGDLPKTRTLGFRWSAANTVVNPNRLSMVAAREFRARRAGDEEAAERDVLQSEWALPAKPDVVDVTKLDYFAIMRRQLPLPRGVCPNGTQFITSMVDIGKRLCHWTTVAWRPNATPHIVDYGRLEVPVDVMDEEYAIRTALADWNDSVIVHGWKGEGDKIFKPIFVLADIGNWQPTVLKSCAAHGPNWIGVKGFGETQRRSYGKRESGSRVIAVGENYNIVQLPTGERFIEANADRAKSWLHARYRTPMDQPGAMTLFESDDHLTFAKHQVAEREEEEFEPGIGMVTRFRVVSRNNHYLDSTAGNVVAGHLGGARLISDPVAPPKKKRPAAERPDWMPAPLQGLDEL